jgi:8-oxo-dGTP pyrophosphatase MutT (NUDIX family)
MIQKPRLAATVILLRPAKQGFEVFLTRRPEGMAFLGGMYCFPGGALRKEDLSEAMVKRAIGLTADGAQKILGADVAPRKALGLWITALRELFEEAGVLLAANASGARRVRDSKQKHQISKEPCLPDPNATFLATLETENLFCDLASLAYFSHWQTPERVSMRFDTRFFLAALPDDQSPLPTAPEVVHSLWVTPDRALQLAAKNQLPMIFPTFASLRTLADFDSMETLWNEYQKKPK